MKKILVLTYGRLYRDPRPNRQIRCLKNDYSVFSAAPKPSGEEALYLPLKKLSLNKQLFRLPLLRLGLFDRYYWDELKKQFVQLADKHSFDLIIAHGIHLIPLALKISKGAKIILDAHEYYPENFSDQFFWRFFFKSYYEFLCKNYLKLCDGIFSATEGVATEYLKNFHVNSEVITNAADYHNLTPSRVDGRRIKIIHHGNANPSRNLELLIDIMDFLDEKYFLDLMLVNRRGSERYYNRLVKMARAKRNVRIIKPVQYREIVRFIHGYDIGMIFRPTVNLNLQFGLGNKFFEYIQARLALAVGPSPEMENIVRRYDLGIVAKDFSPKSMAKEIKMCSLEKLEYYKKQANRHAKDLSASPNYEKMKFFIAQLLE